MFRTRPSDSDRRRRLIAVGVALLVLVGLGAAALGSVAAAPSPSLSPSDPAERTLSAETGPVTETERGLGTGTETGASVLDAVAAAGDAFRFDYAPSAQTLHVGLFAAVTALLGALGYRIASTRRTRGGRLFGATLALLAVRTGSDVVHGVVGELWTFQAILVTGNVLLEVVALSTFCWFAARYTDAGDEHSPGRRGRRATVGLLAVAAGLLATNPLHALVVADYVRISEPFVAVGVEPGPLWWVLIAVEVGLLLVGTGLLARSFTVTDRPSWWAAATLAVALCLALVVVGASAVGVGPLPDYDYRAAGLAGFAILTAIPLLSHGLRRIEITARESIVRELDDAIVVLDDARTIVDANDAAARLLPDPATGRRFEACFDDPPSLPTDGRASTSEVSDAALRGGADPDGASQRRHFLVRATAVRTETGDAIGYTVRFADVTDLRRRTAELERTNDRLDRFASTVTHDLREPLTAASERVGRLLEAVRSSANGDALESEPVDTAMARVARSLDRMRTIIDDILTLARDAESVSDRHLRPFERTVDAAWGTVDADDATLTVEGFGDGDGDGDGNGDPGTIAADHDRLQRLLENLFRNAVEHAGPDVSIVAGLTDDGFYVADDGPGIPADEREDVFDYGYAGSEAGTGLGLAVVEQLASAHGWDVHATDGSDGGARIEISGCTVRDAAGEPRSGSADA